jgi:SAM-dependent methyltransferase
MSIDRPYGDAELAALYDLDHFDYDDDLDLYENFARRGDGPSLELGAGSGRVALHLAREELDVVALDASPVMLDRLRARLEETIASRVRVVEGDMRSFDLGERFDLVYCPLFTFEHLVETEDRIAALRCAEAHLAPGGLFVAGLRPLSVVDWAPGDHPMTVRGTRVDPDSGDTIVKMASVRASGATQTTTTTYIFDRTPKGGGQLRRRVMDVTMRATGQPEAELMLRAAGLRLQQVYGAPDLSPFTDDSDSMIIVAGRA